MFNTQVGRMLDDEHRNALDLLGRVEVALARAKACDAQLAALLREFADAMEVDFQRHFCFEEAHVFPLLDAAGESMVAVMLQEHEDIRAVAAEVLPLARQAAGGGVAQDAWEPLRLGVLELVDRQVSHIQKETVAILPLLEDLLDARADGELALEYASA